ncbi:circadian clock protein LdpA [Leptolyngbya sp. UWPOB_LEPTO1]|uniref:circadian clock protein LdpA n=1 Tax=Leptolyngbya sp. UWPOB_LEPTO1 TaxID=2815653 RepID=UPI00257CDA9B|nr:LdpA C-terminal domain-containing domain [Leptolyngbya sp. UWPOB_LEPTO1]
MIDFNLPQRSLNQGHWFKLICGASFQHLPAIRTLSLVYALAGADCVDVAADPAIVSTAREAFAIANQLAPEAIQRGFTPSNPWLMVSLNDGEDPHFRKAEFNPEICPPDCSRPCELICPADAIDQTGVIDDRCYGCGRCVPICPINQIVTRSYVYTPEVIAPMLLQSGIDAIEIHTQVGRYDDFKRVWNAIQPGLDRLKLIAISCPEGEDLIDYLWALYELIHPLPCALIWQTDGRPMSGDIGDGATRACVKLGEKVLATDIPGYIQLAGGTNRHTVPKLEASGMLHNRDSTPASRWVSGIAYGSYARSLLSPVLTQLEAKEMMPLSDCSNLSPGAIETVPDLLWQAVELASELVHQIKSPNRVLQVI